MTGACFLRYAWIAPQALEEILGHALWFDRFSAHVGLGASLARKVPPSALRSGAMCRILEFARRPQALATPSRRLINSAARWAAAEREEAAGHLVEWCASLVEQLRNLSHCTAGDEAEMEFLARLAVTDFPVLLLWSNSTLARKLFLWSPHGEMRIAAPLLVNPKFRRKAVATCLRYLFGAFGRFGPRDAWVGSGFAEMRGPEQPHQLRHEDESIIIEPDIRWFARHWFSAVKNDVVAGNDAWSHLRRVSLETDCSESATRDLDILQSSANSLGARCWSYPDVDAFLTDTAAYLSRTVEVDSWIEDPHHWWLTRITKRELMLRPSIMKASALLYESACAPWLNRATATAPAQADSCVPYPERVARRNHGSVICESEEFVDWVLSIDGIRNGPSVTLPTRAPVGCAIVIHMEGSRGRYKLCEANPRRTAENIGRHFSSCPIYLDCDGDARSIAPPSDEIDQRLLRRPQEETALEDLPLGVDAMFRFPLAGPPFRAMLARELVSPRYLQAPDLLPIVFDYCNSRPLSFGCIDSENHVWVLSVPHARALADRLRHPTAVAAFYLLEVHEALGAPKWLSATVAGKKSRLPTGSAIAFRWVLHACRSSTAPVIFEAAKYVQVPSVLCDDGGRPLSLELYIIELPSK